MTHLWLKGYSFATFRQNNSTVVTRTLLSKELAPSASKFIWFGRPQVSCLHLLHMILLSTTDAHLSCNFIRVFTSVLPDKLTDLFLHLDAWYSRRLSRTWVVTNNTRPLFVEYFQLFVTFLWLMQLSPCWSRSSANVNISPLTFSPQNSYHTSLLLFFAICIERPC